MRLQKFTDKCHHRIFPRVGPEYKYSSCGKCQIIDQVIEKVLADFKGTKPELQKLSEDELLYLVHYSIFDQTIPYESIIDRLFELVNVNELYLDDNGNTILHTACFSKHYKMVTYLIQKGASINYPNCDNMTPLNICLKSRSWEFFEFLLDSGAEVNSRHSSLLICVYLKKFELAKRLIEKGAELFHLLSPFYNLLFDIEVTPEFNLMTPLDLAIAMKEFEFAKFLIEKGSPFHLINYYREAPIQALIKGDCSSSEAFDFFVYLYDQYVKEGSWIKELDLLPFVCEKEKLPILKYLIDKGADVNARTKDGDAMILFTKDFEAAQVLLEHGVDLSVTDSLGNSLIFVAAGYGDVRLLDCYIEHGLNPKGRDHYEGNALNTAAVQGHYEMFKHLIGLGLDPNQADNEGYGPLHSLAIGFIKPERKSNPSEYFKIIELMRELGVDFKAKNAKGQTAADLIASAPQASELLSKLQK